jgi:hypothetical protein
VKCIDYLEATYGGYFIRKCIYKPFWIMDDECSAPTNPDYGQHDLEARIMGL